MAYISEPSRLLSSCCLLTQIFLVLSMLMFFIVERGGPYVFPNLLINKAINDHYPHGLPDSGNCLINGINIDCSLLTNSTCYNNGICYKSNDEIIQQALNKQSAGISYQNASNEGVFISSIVFSLLMVILIMIYLGMSINKFKCIKNSRYLPSMLSRFVDDYFWFNILNFHFVYSIISFVVFIISLIGIIWLSYDFSNNFILTKNNYVDSYFSSINTRCPNNFYIIMSKTNTPTYEPNNTTCYQQDLDYICCLDNIVTLSDDAKTILPIILSQRLLSFDVYPLIFGSICIFQMLLQWSMFGWCYRQEIIYRRNYQRTVTSMLHTDMFDTSIYYY